MSSSFRAKLKAKPTVGVVLQSASPLVAHSMSAAGFDWLVIDPLNGGGDLVQPRIGILENMQQRHKKLASLIR